MTLAERIAAVPFRRLVWLLPIAFTLHELEEWNILDWYDEQFTNPPTSSDLAVRTWLVGISLLGFVWTAVACALPSARATAAMTLPFFIVFLFGNALQHVHWQLAFGAYAPGVIASAFLNLPAILLLSWHALRNRLVAWPYLAVFYLASLAFLFSTMRAGRTVTPAFQNVSRFSEWLARTLFGAG